MSDHALTIDDVFSRQVEKVRCHDLIAVLSARKGLAPHRRISAMVACEAGLRLDVALDALGGLERCGMVTSERITHRGEEHMTWSLVEK